MEVNYDKIEAAFLYVSMDRMYVRSAILNRETGEVFYSSEMGDSDILPDDVDNHDKYISIPHSNELDLGKALVFDFISEYRPDEMEKVYSLFEHRGAYARFRKLLEEWKLNAAWHRYEETRHEKALREWCQENNVLLRD